MNKLNLDGIGFTSKRTRDRLIQRLRDEGITDQRVLEAMREVPRHIFLDEALSHRAYEDTALPIGQGQTISQPYIVALMTQALLADGVPEKVLEIGTGSGYQTAVLSCLVPQIYSVERIRPLQDKARQRLRLLKARNVQLRHADGGMGWPEKGPFDGIIVTAAPDHIPDELLQQLADGGRMVIPVGPRGLQDLVLITREGDEFHHKSLSGVVFVPLLSGVVR